MGSPGISHPVRPIVLLGSSLSTLIALLAFFGWASGHLLFASFGLDVAPMSFSTAVIFCLLNASIIVLGIEPRPKVLHAVLLLFALAMIVICGATLTATFLGVRGDIERLVFGAEMRMVGGTPISRMSSPFSAAAFCLCALSLLLLSGPRKERGRVLAELMVTAVLLAGVFLVLGHFFGIPSVRGTAFARVALGTSVAFLLSGFSLAFTLPHASIPLRILYGESTVGRLVVLSIALFMGAYFYHDHQEGRFRQEKIDELRAVAQLKTDQISRWRNDRLADATVMSQSPPYVGEVERWLAGRPGSDKEVMGAMALTRRNHGYRDVFVISPDGKRLIDARGEPQTIDPLTMGLIKKASREGKTLFSDFYFCPTHRVVHFDVLAPVKRGNRTIAVAVLRNDPGDFIYKLVQTWPTPSATAETLLVRREGDTVVFLNRLRHSQSAPLSLWIPLSRTDVPAVQAVLGTEGPFEGKDYRGVDVLAFIRAVPDTPWYMVSKVDRKETLSGLRYIDGAIMGFCLAVLLAMGGSAALYRTSREKDAYRRLFERERDLRQAQEEFRTTLYSIGDAVMTTDRDGRVNHMNVVAEQLTGWSEKEARGRKLEEVFHIVNEETRAPVESGVARVFAESRVVGLANHTVLVSRDGREIPVADSGAPIKDQKGKIRGVVLVFRDQTQERAAKKALTESEERFRTMFERHQAVMLTVEPGTGAIVDGNRAAAEYYGYSLDQLRTLNMRDIRPPVAENYMLDGRVSPGRDDRSVVPHRLADGRIRWVKVQSSSFEVGGRVLFLSIIHDVTERERARDEQEIAVEFLRLINEAVTEEEMVHAVVDLVREKSGFDAVGIRLKNGDDYPYYETRGFPPEFIRAESSLCARDSGGLVIRDRDGRAALECMCGSVISGFFDPSKPFCNERGSFWTGSTTDFFAGAAEEDRPACTRNRCNNAGYESVALIVLAVGEERIGLLQMNDRGRDRLSEDDIAFWQRLADYLAIALTKLRAEKALAESEGLYRSLVSASPDAIAVVEEGSVLFAAPKTLEVFGHAPGGDVSGQKALEWVAAEDREEAAGYLEEVLKEGVPKVREFNLCRHDGTTFAGEINAAAFRSPKGPGGMVLVVRDVSDRKHAEEERRRLEEQLRQAQKMEAVGTLAGGIAHDFNNILTVIVGLSNLIQMKIDKEDQIRPYVDQILISSNRAADLTQSLLAFSRKQRISPEPHDINEVVTTTAKLLRRLLPEDIELVLDLTPERVVARVDLTQINQALMNLTTNARDAMLAGGKLVVRTGVATLDEGFRTAHGFGRPGEYVRLSVSDTGIGMDEKTMERIFDPFFTTKEIGKGTGLGLASVYGIVKQHGGYISVSSEHLGGTTFDIYLPFSDAEGHHTTGAFSEEFERGNETVLVVEDDPEVRHMLTRMLYTHGYATIEAGDGEDGIRLYRENREKIDLVLLDVVMPKLNGKQVLEEIAKTDPDVRAIFVSGYTGDVMIDKGIESDKVDFVQKPLSAKSLFTKIREVLDR